MRCRRRVRACCTSWRCTAPVRRPRCGHTSRTMDALRVLAEKGTKESRERAAGALFELDEETRAS